MSTVTELFRFEAQRAVPRERLELTPERGIDGDDHAGPGDKQVVLADDAAMAAVRSDPDRGLCYRRFVPNITATGLRRADWPAGRRFSCGTALLEVTGYKHCFPGECPLPADGDCPLRDGVLFAKVCRAGIVAENDTIAAK